jgi:hypothetical protein
VETDWVARIIAFVAVLIAGGSLAWSFYTWRQNGAVVKVDAWRHGLDQALRIKGTLVSAGRLDASVIGASFEWYTAGASRLMSCEIPADNLGGIEFPLPMPVHGTYKFEVLAVGQIDPGLWTALHESRPVTIVFRTPTGGRATATIKYPPTPPK